MSRLSFMIAASALSLVGCDRGSEETSQRHSEGQVTNAGGSNANPPPLPGQIVRTQAGTKMPELTFKDPDGNTLALADLKGTPVLLNIWATWCVPCVIEMPLLDSLAGELGDDVKVLTVSQDLKGAEKVVPFFAQRDFEHLEPWLDQENQLFRLFAQDGLLPTTILFDAQGRELFRVAGDYEWDSEEAIAQIREAIADGESSE